MADVDIWNNFKGFESTINRRHEVTRTYPPCNLNHGGPCSACGELSQIEAQIEEMHARIQQIRSTIEDLHEKHCAISTKRNALHKCSITKLPYEIASDILIRACIPGIRPSCVQTYNKQDFSTFCRPARLATVCRSWRELVLSIPELWSSFSITPSTDIYYIKCCLERSGTSPLFIRLDTNNGYFASEPPYNALDAITLVKQNIPRTAYLCLSMHRQLIGDFMSRSIWPDAAPLLDEFHIHAGPEGDPCSIDLELCTSLPKPSKIVASDFLVSKVHLDWLRVSQLSLSFDHMDSTTLNDLLSVLPNVQSLVEFEWHCIKEHGPFLSNDIILTSQPVRMITSHSIRKITLHDRMTAFAIFRHTTMPSLELLTLFKVLPDLLDSLSRFLQRSACPLTSLELSFSSYPKSEGNKLLSFVKRLSLGSATNTPHDLSAQPQFAGPNVFVPHLRTFKYSGQVHIPISHFLDIMENRSTISDICPLEEMTVSVLCYPAEFKMLMTEQDLQRILELSPGRTISILHLDRNLEYCPELLHDETWFSAFDL